MIKIKNNILLKNIIILLVSGAVAKIIGMVGKIIYTRIAGINVISLYTLITPTFMLIISLTQFSFPISISKLSAEEKYNGNDLIKNAYFIGFTIDIILAIIILMSSNFIANMLHNSSLSIAIKSISIIILFVTISSIQRGFLHGKENMLPASITNIIEEILKIVLIIIFLPLAVLSSNISVVIAIIVFNVITEIISIIIMNNVIKKKYLTNTKGKLNINIMKDIIKISFPTTMVRLISSLGFFLEPIILTNVLINNGYDTNYIVMEYGIINSYIIPLLSIPTFFSISIAAALLPNLTKAYFNKKYNEFNNKLFKLMTISILVGIICLAIILIFPKLILNTVYNISMGINYLYLLGPFFLILYMQPTLSVALQAMNKTNKLFLISIISMIIKYSSLTLFGFLGLGMNALTFAIIIGMVATTSMVLFVVLKELFKKKDN